ncbi:hypothetical protein OJAV_G00173060 [Oryzias javanicus]|uniref:Uncharacterized protein n=1 Tax=Oryzias javanicus TaxID=123683 RepID=A0A437CH88_ORYJA|nr:hypothetical protein OJAV_G00173060 [Oryzias javanicus]
MSFSCLACLLAFIYEKKELVVGAHTQTLRYRDLPLIKKDPAGDENGLKQKLAKRSSLELVTRWIGLKQRLKKVGV